MKTASLYWNKALNPAALHDILVARYGVRRQFSKKSRHCLSHTNTPLALFERCASRYNVTPSSRAARVGHRRPGHNCPRAIHWLSGHWSCHVTDTKSTSLIQRLYRTATELPIHSHIWFIWTHPTQKPTIKTKHVSPTNVLFKTPSFQQCSESQKTKYAGDSTTNYIAINAIPASEVSILSVTRGLWRCLDLSSRIGGGHHRKPGKYQPPSWHDSENLSIFNTSKWLLYERTNKWP